MAESIAVNPNPAASGKSHSIHHWRFAGIDLLMGLGILTLFIIGLLMVYSSSWEYAQALGNPVWYYLILQIRNGLFGIALAVFLVFFDYRRFEKFLVPMLVVIIVSLLFVALFGEVRNGARRALFGGSIQPSELAKLVLIIYLSFWLVSKKEMLDDFWYGILPLGFILGLIVGLIALQPDFSTAVTIFYIGAILFFLSEVDVKQVILLVTIALVFGGIIVYLFPTGNERITLYLDGLRDPANAADHVRSAVAAIVNGGVFGVGIGMSTMKFTHLPVAPTDSIFAVLTEEMGLMGAALVIGLYILILWRGLKIARNAPDMTGKLMAAGITLWIFWEAFINIGMLVNLVPVVGNALPWISAGGSNLVVMFAAIGILLGIGRQSERQSDSKEGRSFSAVVDMRGRDRRRRVSRPGRPSSFGN